MVILDGFCSAPSSSSPPQGRRSRVPTWPQVFPYSFWAYELKRRIQSRPIRSVITAGKPTCDGKPACRSQSAQTKLNQEGAVGGRGNTPREPQLKDHQTHTGHFIFQPEEAWEIQIPTYFCISGSLKRDGG